MARTPEVLSDPGFLPVLDGQAFPIRVLPRAQPRFLIGEGIGNIDAGGVASRAEAAEGDGGGEAVGYADAVGQDFDFALEGVGGLGFAGNGDFLNEGACEVGVKATYEQAPDAQEQVLGNIKKIIIFIQEVKD